MTLTLDAQEMDLGTAAALETAWSKIAGPMTNGLTPGVEIRLGPPSPNYTVTAKDRAQAGVYFSMLRALLTSAAGVDPAAIQLTFVNYR